MVLLGQLQDQLAGHHQCLLVGQGNGLACLDGAERGTQACKTHQGREHHVHRLHLHHLTQGVGAGIYLYGLVLQCLTHVFVAALVGNDHTGGLELPCLSDEQVGLTVGRQHIGLKEVLMGFDNLKRLRADAPRGSQDADAFTRAYLIIICVLRFHFSLLSISHSSSRPSGRCM